MTITPELKQAVDRAGVGPVLLKGPDTKTHYLGIRREVYERLLTVERVDRSLYDFGEFYPDK